MEGFAFNLRRPLFADMRVREALGLMFDFEWINANLYDGLYKRTKSFFDDSELASTGRAASAARACLARAVSRRGSRRYHGRPLAAGRQPTVRARDATQPKRADRAC